jgi:3-oxoadipate enol-lactonase
MTSMATVDVHGIIITYDDCRQAGEAENTLLLIHGHPFNRSMWRPQAEAIARWRSRWRVIVPDLRGYGETTVVPGKTTLDVFANDLAALLDHLGIARAVVGGLSMGGQIAMEFARLHPHRLDGIMLAATYARAETDDVRRYRRELADRLERERDDDGEGMARLADELLPKMLAPASISSMPDVAVRVHAMMRHTSPRGAAAALRGRAERESNDAVLAGLNVPALIVAGDQDPFTTREDAERMRTLLANSRLLWLEGVGHMPNLERPQAFNEALVAFLESLESLDSLNVRDADRAPA